MTGRSRPAVAVLLATLAFHGPPAEAAPWKYQRVVTSPKVHKVAEVATNDAGTLVVAVGVTTVAPVTGGGESPPQVVAYDTRTKKGSLVTVGTDGKPGNAYSSKVSVSGDGRYVLFQSLASNLVKGDTNGASDVFVRDLKARRTTRVSVSHTGRQLPAGSGRGVISGNGSTVVFDACGPMSPGAKTLPGECGLYARKLHGGRPIPLTADKSGKLHHGYEPSISRDGRYVAFHTSGNSALTPDTPATYYNQVYVADTVQRSLFRVPGEKTTVPGVTPVDEFADASIDPTGTWVVARQSTYATSAVFVTGPRHILVNLATGAVTVLGPAGRPFVCCTAPGRFSGDGGAVVYGVSEPDTDGRATSTVYRRTIKTGATEKVSAPAPAAACASDAGCASPSYGSLAPDRTGQRIVVATNVRHAADDTDGWPDAYLVTR